MNGDAKQLSRYLDGDLTPDEVAELEARLSASASLRRELGELRGVGDELRQWSRGVEERADGLLELTLARVGEQEQRRTRRARVGYVAAALVVLALPWARISPPLVTRGAPVSLPAAAAIERVEATDRRAEVFVVGSASTPVLWLADDSPEAEQDPG